MTSRVVFVATWVACFVWGGSLWAQPASDGGPGTSPGYADAPRLSDAVELDQIIELYMAGQYEDCTGRLAGLLDAKGPAPFRDAGVIEKGRLYFASCALLSGRREPARRALRSALEANPLMPAPDSLTFPPPVVSLFLEVRDEVQQLIAKREQEQLDELRREAEAREEREELRKRRQGELLMLARQETLIEKNSRVIASLPFGAGQFQNEKPALGAAFLVSEALLASAALYSAVHYSELRALGPAAGQEVNGPLQATYQVLVVSSFALLSVTALGILEAHWTFRDERTLGTRERDLPPELVEELGDEAPESVEGERETSADSQATERVQRLIAPPRVSTLSSLRPAYAPRARIEWAPVFGASADGAHVSIVGRF